MSGAKKKVERRAQAQMGLSEREKQELQKKQAQRRNSMIATVAGVVAVVLVAALLVWNTGVFDRHITAVKFAAPDGTSGDVTLTRADMDYFYYQALNNLYTQEQSLASMYEQNGLEYTPSFDPRSSLKTQYIDQDQTMSYDDYFRQQALSDATQVVALSNAAKAAGHTLSETAQASLDGAGANLDAWVQQSGLGSRTNYLRNVYGRAMSEKVYFENLERNILASDYYSTVTGAMGDYTEQELETYYAEHADELDDYSYDYAYFDGTAPSASDAEGNAAEPTDEEKAAALAAAKQSAEDMMAAVRSNAAAPAAEDEDAEGAEGQTETKDFSTLAQDLGGQAYTQTDNAGSNLTGAPFAQWLMDAARVDGDMDVFEVEGSGYYVVQFHSRQRNNDPTVDVRHILAAFEAEEDVEHEQDENGNIIFTDAEKQTAHDAAAAWLDSFNAGEKTAEAFGQLAEANSADGRDQEGNLNAEGGLYEGVKVGDMVQPFEDWCFDPARQEGDTGLVETTYGWHVMYFQAYNRPVWMDTSEKAMLAEEQQTFLEETTAGYEPSVNKWYKAPAQESQAPQEDQAN